MNVSIRPVVSEDNEVVARLLREFFRSVAIPSGRRRLRQLLPRAVGASVVGSALVNHLFEVTPLQCLCASGLGLAATYCFVSLESRNQMEAYVASATDLDQGVAEHFNGPKHAFVVAQVQRPDAPAEVVGCAGIKPWPEDPNAAELVRLCLRPDMHSKRIGAELLTVLEHKAREIGYSSLILRTNALLDKAVRFYERNGFRLIGTLARPHLYRGDLLYYSKSLQKQ